MNLNDNRLSTRSDMNMDIRIVQKTSLNPAYEPGFNEFNMPDLTNDGLSDKLMSGFRDLKVTQFPISKSNASLYDIFHTETPTPDLKWTGSKLGVNINNRKSQKLILNKHSYKYIKRNKVLHLNSEPNFTLNNEESHNETKRSLVQPGSRLR